MPARTSAVAVVLVFGLGTVAGCGSGGTGHPATLAADCAAAIRFHGHQYWGRSVAEPIRFGRTLGHGVIPSCQDGGGDGETVTVRAIRGQDPGTVIANDRRPLLAYAYDRRAALPAGLQEAPGA